MVSIRITYAEAPHALWKRYLCATVRVEFVIVDTKTWAEWYRTKMRMKHWDNNDCVLNLNVSLKKIMYFLAANVTLAPLLLRKHSTPPLAPGPSPFPRRTAACWATPPCTTRY